MKNTYWNGTGQFQSAYNELLKLMPFTGAADTLAGELIRSVSRLGYDFYNNGMGNNTSGAVNFLLHNGAIDKDTHSTIYEFTRGRIYSGRYGGDSLQRAIERAVDMTVEMITRNPQLIIQKNAEDMFDYSEPDQHYCNDCGGECDRGWICEECEECEEYH